MGGGESLNKLIFNYTIAILATGWLGLLSSSITLASDDLKFNRRCNTAQQCVFTPTGSSDNVYLDCKNGYCACARFTRIADVPVWDLNWSDPANGQLRECLIAETGPCGEDNSIKISCMTGLDCLDKRCRSRDKIKTHKLGEWCKETIDCEQGLTCATTSFYFQPIKTCIDPENPRPVTNRSNHQTNDQEPITTSTTTTTTFIQPTKFTATTTTVQPENITTKKDSSSQSVIVMSNNSTEKSSVQMENFNGTLNTTQDDEDEDMPANRHNNAVVISSSIFSSLITVTTLVLVLSSSLLVE